MKMEIFEYGQVVSLLICRAGHEIGSLASVCGIFPAATQHLADKYKVELNDFVYTIEFGNGESIEVNQYEICAVDYS